MSNYNFGGRSRGGRDSGGRALMHDAICNECGKDCKVPFRPSGDKPVFCSECFERKGGGENNRSGGRGSYGRSRFDGNRSSGVAVGPDFSKLTRNIEVLNNKLDKIISLLEPKKAEKEGDGVAEIVASLTSNKVDKKKNKPIA